MNMTEQTNIGAITITIYDGKKAMEFHNNTSGRHAEIIPSSGLIRTTSNDGKERESYVEANSQELYNRALRYVAQ
jgi:hypothetical protein